MTASIEQTRLGAQLIVMDALLECARVSERAAPSAQDIALVQILRMLARPEAMTPCELEQAIRICEEPSLIG